MILTALLSLNDYSSFQIGVYRDDANYVILARSLVQSPQYGLINVPGEARVSKYPFGYPLLLSPLVLLLPTNLDALRVPSLLATLLNISLLFWGWRWLSRRTSYWWGLAVASLYGLSPLTINHTRMVMSEPIFTTFCLSALILIEQFADGARARGWSLFMSFTLLGMVFTRTVGIVAVAGIFAYGFIVHRPRFWREVSLIVLQMLLLLGFAFVATSAKPANLFAATEYLNEFDLASSVPLREAPQVESRLLFRLVENAKQHLQSDIRQIIVPVGGATAEQALTYQFGIFSPLNIFGWLMSGLLVIGFVRWFVLQRLSAFQLVGMVYLATLFIWLAPGTRLFYPIQPQLFFGWLLGVETLLLAGARLLNGWRVRRSWAKIVLVTGVLILLSVSVAKSLTIDHSRLHTGDLEARTSWLKAHLSHAEIVMTEEPETDFLYGGTKTIPFPAYNLTANNLREYLRQNHVQYILFAPQVIWLPHAVAEYSDRAIQLLQLLDSPELSSRTQLLYSSEPERIKVIRMQP